MPEAVIVATARTPIGRANKGSLIECRPDDLSALIIDAVLAKVPSLDPAQVEDVIWGCGQPAGEAGTNVGRVAALLAGLEAPGVTVNRYCSSSLQTIRMAAHAIKAGEGDVFISGGVETVSRFMNGMADGGPANEKFNAARERTKLRSEGGQPSWTPSGGLEDVYIAMGQTAERHGRQGRPGKRPHDEIGYHAIRVGDNPGEHTIVFGMLGETIELAVRATNRDCYVAGALAAAKFLVGQKPGLYGMNDVLGL